MNTVGATPGHGATGWVALLLLFVLAYALGLDGQHIPSNGDEMVYAHIARLTAASGHWLPLASELEHMRNTKPPLLFWQAMVAGNWGQHWHLWALRAPSLVYTLLVTLAIGLCVRRLSGNPRTALVAACVYLAFFCTFRYGRPYLTSAAESFWLNLPMFWLLWRVAASGQQPSGSTPATAPGAWSAGGYVLAGVALGLGAAYKSFALIAPAAATLWCALLLAQRPVTWQVLCRTTAGCGLSVALGLGIFSLWLLLDPDPAAVWREFVVGENAGKLAGPEGYWHAALRGGSSIWAQLLAYLQDAGLLAFAVLGLAWSGWKSWRQRQPGKPIPLPVQILLVWLAVWLLVFTIPSQRSARYVIPAMPAMAMLLALCWSRIGRGWFVATLLLAAPFILLLSRIAWVGSELGIGTPWHLGGSTLALLLGLACVLGGLLRPAWTRACALLACVSVYLCLNFALLPLDGPAGRFPPAAAAAITGAVIAVPNGFNGQFERFQFLLPGKHFVPYDVEQRARSQAALAGATGTAAANSPQDQLRTLLGQHDGVVWLQAQAGQTAPPCLPACVLRGERWQLKGRHESGEIRLTNIWYPQDWLFRHEWLLQRQP